MKDKLKQVAETKVEELRSLGSPLPTPQVLRSTLVILHPQAEHYTAANCIPKVELHSTIRELATSKAEAASKEVVASREEAISTREVGSREVAADRVGVTAFASGLRPWQGEPG